MFLTRKIAKIDTTNKMIVAFDIGEENLDYYSEIKGKISRTSCREIEAIRDHIQNRTGAITKALGTLAQFASERGFDGLHVVCEPTGNYGLNLIKTAHRLGHSTAWVSGENVHKARVLENNDNSKSDTKDPRTIYMLATMGKELVIRQLSPDYIKLRELNRMYDDADERRTQMKNQLHHLLVRLFCEYPMSKDFLYSASGKTLVEKFKCNPYKIVGDSYKKFSKTMRSKCPKIMEKSLTELYKAAEASVLHCMSEPEQEALEQRVTQDYEDFMTSDERKESIRVQIAEMYQKLWDAGEKVPKADGEVFTAFQLGRIIGETGPLSDFEHWRVLFKYAGMNLRTRQSGKYKGKLKMSKKGRVPVRQVCGKLVFGMVRSYGIFGPYYHGRKEANPKLKGTQLLANVERKLLRMIYSMGMKREVFNEKRFVKCETQFRKAA